MSGSLSIDDARSVGSATQNVYWSDSVTCSGRETEIRNCNRQSIGSECQRPAWVMCQGTPTGGFSFLSHNTQRNSFIIIKSKMHHYSFIKIVKKPKKKCTKATSKVYLQRLEWWVSQCSSSSTWLIHWLESQSPDIRCPTWNMSFHSEVLETDLRSDSTLCPRRCRFRMR